MKACYLAKRENNRIDYVYPPEQKQRYEARLEIYPHVIYEDNLEAHKEFLKDCEVAISTWHAPELTEEEITQYLPSLKLLLYAAGSVQYFARPFLRCGVRIVSAWGAMNYPVAQFTVSNIVLANKGAFLASRAYHQGKFEEGGRLCSTIFPGTYRTKVGILGAGKIGALVLEMLKGYPVEALVYDPFLSEAAAEKLGARKTTLEEIFETCQTVSNHIANNERTKNMLDYSLFSRMKPNAAFINTGRGAQVVEADLVRALQEEPLRCAILDVTEPEPCAPGHPFYTMPNVVMFPHIAGSAVSEVLGMSDLCLEELLRYQQGALLEFEVTMPMLETMA